ncbi:MAG: hypothetical protein K0R44_596 [Thermomicrobiales bacterium]|nr:hypothetical protein [Thermomicrobiales bacterium]
MPDNASVQSLPTLHLTGFPRGAGPSRAVCRESGGNVVKTALVRRSIHATHRSAPIGGHDHATSSARRAGVSHERRVATTDAERSTRSPAQVAAAASAGGDSLPSADSAPRAQPVQMRPLPHLRRADCLRRPAPQSLPHVPDLPSRRSTPAGGSIEPLSRVDGSRRSCLSARRGADGGPSLQRLRCRASEPGCRRRQPDGAAAARAR